jgi:SMI1 / KNR4 family (SUKH-1)
LKTFLLIITIIFLYKILRNIFLKRKKSKRKEIDYYYSEMDKFPQNIVEIIIAVIMEISSKYLKDDYKKFKGHIDVSIINLEADLKVKLPYAYKHFLRKIATGDLTIFDSQGYSIKDVYYSQESASAILSYDKEVLPHNAFVFSEWQGYNFYYFINDGSENPDTYLYIERGDDENNTPSGSYYQGKFTDWLLKLAIGSLELHKSFDYETQEGINKLKKYLSI